MGKTIPKKKKCKKAKWLSEEALQIAVKRGEMKGKGEKHPEESPRHPVKAIPDRPASADVPVTTEPILARSAEKDIV